MKFLVIGSGRFVAPKVLEELVYAKHEVALVDPNPPPADTANWVTHIAASKDSLGFYRDECLEFKPDVAIHLSANTREETTAFLELFQGQVAHVVATSNTNVYQAHARLRKTESGPAIAVPINEASPLRAKPLREDEPGDKRDVEKLMNSSKEPCTLLRLAPLYGPNDFLRRFYPLIVRMIDKRPFILLGKAQADWKWTHAYVNDAAHAIALAAMQPEQRHRVYNVGELKTPTVKERIEHLGTVFGWDGRVSVLLDSALPDYLQTPGDFSQDLLVDSSRIRSELGFKEVADYYDGLAESVEWYQANPPPNFAGKKFSYAAEDAVGGKEQGEL